MWVSCVLLLRSLPVAVAPAFVACNTTQQQKKAERAIVCLCMRVVGGGGS